MVIQGKGLGEIPAVHIAFTSLYYSGYSEILSHINLIPEKMFEQPTTFIGGFKGCWSRGRYLIGVF